MKKGGIDKLAEQIADLARDNTLLAYENWKDGVGSPIEAIMLIGMFQSVPLDDFYFAPIISVEVLGDRPLHPKVIERCSRWGCMTIEKQVRLLDWRVDFVISCPSISGKKVVIECDGHDFHERTKEQAQRDRSRDRAVQEAGHRMLRYTGSEIYRDPLGCCRSAIRSLADFIEDDWLSDIKSRNP